MDDKKRLPDAELAVMQAIWEVGGEVSRGGRSKAHLRQRERRQCQRGEESGDPAGKL